MVLVVSVGYIRWYCYLHISFFYTSWFVYRHTGTTEEAEVDSNSFVVRLAAVGLLIAAIANFISSSLLTQVNRFLGITNNYHLSAMLYGVGTCLLYLFPSTYFSYAVMALLGATTPPLYSSAYVLIEVHATDHDETEQDDEREEHEDGSISLHAPTRSPTSSRTRYHHRRGSDSSLHLDTISPKTDTRANSGHVDDDNTPLLVDSQEHTHWELPNSEFSVELVDEKRGLISSLYNVTMIIAQIVVASTSGYIIEYSGNIALPFAISGILLVFTNIALLIAGATKPSRKEIEHEVAVVAAPRIEKRTGTRYGAADLHSPLLHRPRPAKLRRSTSAPVFPASRHYITPRKILRHPHRNFLFQPRFAALINRGFGTTTKPAHSESKVQRTRNVNTNNNLPLSITTSRNVTPESGARTLHGSTASTSIVSTPRRETPPRTPASSRPTQQQLAYQNLIRLERLRKASKLHDLLRSFRKDKSKDKDKETGKEKESKQSSESSNPQRNTNSPEQDPNATTLEHISMDTPSTHCATIDIPFLPSFPSLPGSLASSFSSSSSSTSLSDHIDALDLEPTPFTSPLIISAPVAAPSSRTG